MYGRLIIIYKTDITLQLLQKLDALCELTINSDINERRLISKKLIDTKLGFSCSSLPETSYLVNKTLRPLGN